MSTATEEKPAITIPNALIGHVEQVRCGNPACDAAIPADCVVSNIDRKTGTRRVKVYCEHCRHMYRQRYRLYGGLWVQDGEVEEITDKREISGFIARVDFVRGNRQRVA